MAERDEGFLSRWSRLKSAETQRREEPPVAEAAPAAGTATQSPAEQPPAEAGQTADLAELPPIESLTKDSDYTAFLRQGVPPELRRDALRALWRSDPVFANLDGLLEYGEDFGAQFRTGGVVATIYRVGKGMVDAAADEPPDLPAEAEEARDPTAEAAVTEGGPVDTADAKETAEESDPDAQRERDTRPSPMSVPE